MSKFLTITLIWFGCLVCASAQVTVGPNMAAGNQQASPSVPDNSTVWNGNLGDEPVGPSDLLFISVAGSQELSRSFRVGSDGTVSLPMAHSAVQVAGMVPAEIAKVVTKALVEDGILVSPIVSVTVMDYQSRRVSVVGAVRAPTVVQAIGRFTLLDAIAKAQGFAPEAGPEVIVTRRALGSAKQEEIRIPIRELLAGRKDELNTLLHGGEEVRVPEARKLFIVGNVRLPGGYPISDLEGTTVLKALAMSQGQLPYTSSKAYIFRTVDGSAEKQQIMVPLKEIMHRNSPDVALMANDILYIPQNGALATSADVLGRVANFGSQAGAAVLVHY